MWFPVQLHGGELNGGMAINHNMGPGGMLIASSAELAAGTEVMCSFVVPSSSKQQQIKGRVIRVEKNADDPDGMWPYRIALAFEYAPVRNGVKTLNRHTMSSAPTCAGEKP